MLKIMFNYKSQNKQTTKLDGCQIPTLEAILNDNDLMSIIENMQSMYVCRNFVKLYTEFKNSSKDTIKELHIIGKCERIFNTKWTRDFLKNLQMLN
jgi:hypothetical protein